MGGLFGGGAPPAPPPVPSIDTVKKEQEEAAKNAAEADKIKRQNRGGYNALLNPGTGFEGVGTLGTTDTLGSGGSS